MSTTIIQCRSRQYMRLIDSAIRIIRDVIREGAVMMKLCAWCWNHRSQQSMIDQFVPRFSGWLTISSILLRYILKWQKSPSSSPSVASPCIEFVDYVNDNQKYDIDDQIMLRPPRAPSLWTLQSLHVSTHLVIKFKLYVKNMFNIHYGWKFWRTLTKDSFFDRSSSARWSAFQDSCWPWIKKNCIIYIEFNSQYAVYICGEMNCCYELISQLADRSNIGLPG